MAKPKRQNPTERKNVARREAGPSAAEQQQEARKLAQEQMDAAVARRGLLDQSIRFEELPDACPVCGVSGLAPCERDQETDPEGFTGDGFPMDHTGRPVAYANQDRG